LEDESEEEECPGENEEIAKLSLLSGPVDPEVLP
jgi:hypothetical protein